MHPSHCLRRGAFFDGKNLYVNNQGTDVSANSEADTSVTLVWFAAAGIRAQPRIHLLPFLAPLESSRAPEPVVAYSTKHAAYERAPVLPTCCRVFPDLEELPALAWPVAVRVRASPRTCCKGLVAGPLKCAAMLEPLVACIAKYAACERVPVLPPCRHAFFDPKELDALVWTITAGVHASLEVQWEFIVGAPPECPFPREPQEACIAQHAAFERAPVLRP